MAHFKWELARGLVKLTNPRLAGLELLIARDEPIFADGVDKLPLENDRVPSVLTFSKSERLNNIKGSYSDRDVGKANVTQILPEAAHTFSSETSRNSQDPELEQREVERAGIERMAGKFFNKLHADILGITEEEYTTYQQDKDPETGQRLKFSGPKRKSSHPPLPVFFFFESGRRPGQRESIQAQARRRDDDTSTVLSTAVTLPKSESCGAT